MKVLIVEDEPDLRQAMVDFLTKEGYVIEIASDFDMGNEKLALYTYDCVLLDIMMPYGNGIDLLRAIRQQGKDVPVIIISAKDSLEDKVSGLELGADDYLPKPFHLVELNARIKSAIRRSNKQVDNTISVKNIRIFPEDRKAMIADRELQLNRKEFDVLYYLMIRPEKLVQKSLLAESIWGDSIDQVDNLDFIYSQIKNLRKKLKEHGAEIDIQTVYGIGYKLV